MSNQGKKIGLKAVIVLGLGLFLVGYVVGTFLPLPVFGEDSFLGATRRPGPNPNSHRD